MHNLAVYRKVYSFSSPVADAGIKDKRETRQAFFGCCLTYPHSSSAFVLLG